MKTNKRDHSKRGLLSLTEVGFAHDGGCKITLHFLAGLLSCLLSAQVTFGLPQKAKSSEAPAAAASIAGKLTVMTGQGELNNLAGVVVKLSGASQGVAVQSTLTDDNGGYEFT
jgi:hypothetical protein